MILSLQFPSSCFSASSHSFSHCTLLHPRFLPPQRAPRAAPGFKSLSCTARRRPRGPLPLPVLTQKPFIFASRATSGSSQKRFEFCFPFLHRADGARAVPGVSPCSGFCIGVLWDGFCTAAFVGQVLHIRFARWVLHTGFSVPGSAHWVLHARLSMLSFAHQFCELSFAHQVLHTGFWIPGFAHQVCTPGFHTRFCTPGFAHQFCTPASTSKQPGCIWGSASHLGSLQLLCHTPRVKPLTSSVFFPIS